MAILLVSLTPERAPDVINRVKEHSPALLSAYLISWHRRTHFFFQLRLGILRADYRKIWT